MNNLTRIRVGGGLLFFAMMAIVLSAGSMALAALPADPDNAAPLYYQAALRLALSERPYPGLAVDDVLDGDGGHDQVRDYLGKATGRGVVILVEAASRMRACDWGFMHSLGWVPDSFGLALNRLGCLLAAKARIQAADGQYRPALETCLTLRRLAAHVGDATPLLWAVSGDTHRRSLSAIRDVLAVMPADENLLVWIKDGLTCTPGKPWHPKATFRHFAELEIQARKVLPEEYKGYRENLLGRVKDDVTRGELRRLSEVELLGRAQEAFGEFLEEAEKIWDSDAALAEQWRRLDLLVDESKQRGREGDAIYILRGLLGRTRRFHEAHVNHAAISNALMTAIEIHFVKAKTGRLPETLPAGSRQNPYNGRPFEYQVTDTGFLLRCPDTPPELWRRDGQRVFEFRVRE